MKKLLILLLLASPCQAEITSTLSSSTSLTVGASSTQSTRIPSTYSVSGSNVKVVANAQFGGLTAPSSATAVATMIQGDYEVNTAGSAFTFSESFQNGDPANLVNAGVDVASGVIADLPAFGITTSVSGGVAGTLAGTVLSSGIVTVVAGGANTTGIGQVVSEITVR
tara:strand:- start:845 stop:1345 length:501 start_codon:yes stop_codon:yes gene_type:complete